MKKMVRFELSYLSSAGNSNQDYLSQNSSSILYINVINIPLMVGWTRAQYDYYHKTSHRTKILVNMPYPSPQMILNIRLLVVNTITWLLSSVSIKANAKRNHVNLKQRLPCGVINMLSVVFQLNHKWPIIKGRRE